MKSNFIKTIALTLATTFMLSLPIKTFAQGEEPVQAQGDVLTLGSDLTEAQKKSLLEYFKAPEGTRTVLVTDDTIIKQLGLDPNDPSNYAGGCYSSAYVKLTEEGTGIKVTSSNLTEVTDSMLANALITSGVINAEVKASAPFKVTGTAALSGILEGVETVAGFEISLKKKETAQKEIEVTMDLADKIGDVEASSMINDIKTEVIKEQPTKEKDIEKIVENISENYEATLTEEDKKQVVALMNDINGLDLDYSKLKDSLTQAGNEFKDKLAEMGKEIKESGIFEKAWDWICDLFSDMWDGIKSLFSNDDADLNTGETTGDVDNTVDKPIEKPVEDVEAETDKPIEENEAPTDNEVEANIAPDEEVIDENANTESNEAGNDSQVENTDNEENNQ